MGWQRGARVRARGGGYWRERGSKSRRVLRECVCLGRDQRDGFVPGFAGVGPWNHTTLEERGIGASSRGTVCSEPCMHWAFQLLAPPSPLSQFKTRHKKILFVISEKKFSQLVLNFNLTVSSCTSILSSCNTIGIVS